MDFMEKYYGADIKAVGNILKELSNSSILEKHHIKFPRELVLLGRVITMVEDMGQKLIQNSTPSKYQSHWLKTVNT